MLATFPVPILSVTTDAVRDLQGQDALYGLWTVFTKCKESVQDGRRLENISWRLWYRELLQAQVIYRAPTPESVTPHPKDERFRSSYFSAHPDEKASPKREVLSSGLPSPSDQASPSPLPPLMSTMVPPSTPERPRISPPTAGSTVPFSSFAHGKSTPCVGRLIVDMLPNQLFIPHSKPTSATTSKKAALSTPPSSVYPSRSSDLNVPLVQLPATVETPFPRVVVVNPTPHPTPPTTPILQDDTPGAPQPPSTFLLPPLPAPAFRPVVPSSEVAAQQPPPRSLATKELSLSYAPTRIADVGSLARQPDRRFFLQQSPEDGSSERGDGSTASKSPSDMFAASSVTSSQIKSAITDADGDDDSKSDHEEEEHRDEDEDDRRSMTAAGAGARRGRQNKAKRGKEVGKRPPVKRSHSARHVAPSMARRLSAQQQQHTQQERVEKKGAAFNIGSGSSNGSRSANGSTGKGHARCCPPVNGLATIQPSKVSPLQVQPPVIPKGFNGRIDVDNVALNGNAKPNLIGNVNGSANTNAQSRKTIVVANSSSEEFETTDGEDSEEWASEEMDADDRARQAEETRLREAALEVQRQRELFAKVPKRSYSNLNRTQSGLLSQLMNPDPTIFPPNHPYRVSRSSVDIPRLYQYPQHHAPVPQRSSSAHAPPRLSTSKSAAALPMAAQITAISSSKPPPPPSSAMRSQENKQNGYRPKGPPMEQEMEDDSGDDANDKIEMSQSVAQQKLQALMSRRSAERSSSSRLIQPVAMEVGPSLLSSTTAPIPLGHPYNLPAPTPPMTPKTTRRRMLKTELSESMRRQLLWERQVSSNANAAVVARRATQGTGRPTTSTSSDGIRDTAAKTAEALDKDERRRHAMARNRSWATDDYHYTGW